MLHLTTAYKFVNLSLFIISKNFSFIWVQKKLNKKAKYNKQKYKDFRVALGLSKVSEVKINLSFLCIGV